MSISKATILSLVGAVVAAGCGGSNTSKTVPDMLQAPGDMLQSQPGDMLQSQPGDLLLPPPPPSCPLGTQCGVGTAQQGICQPTGECGCTGNPDCSGYAGTTSASMVTVKAAAARRTPIAPPDRICNQGVCGACQLASDCPGALPYCNGGVCSATAPACVAETSCNGGTGWCCPTAPAASTTFCGAGPPSGGCCQDSDCGGNGATCNLATHVCKPSACTDVLGSTIYVNPSRAAAGRLSGVGTKQCPFVELVSAFNALP